MTAVPIPALPPTGGGDKHFHGDPAPDAKTISVGREARLLSDFDKTVEDLNLRRLLQGDQPEKLSPRDLVENASNLQLQHLVESLGSIETAAFCHPSNQEHLTCGLAEIAACEAFSDKLRVQAVRQMTRLAKISRKGKNLDDPNARLSVEVIKAGDPNRSSTVMPASYFDSACEVISQLVGKSSTATRVDGQMMNNGVQILEEGILRGFSKPVYAANYDESISHDSRYKPEHEVLGQHVVRYPVQLSPRSVIKSLSSLVSKALESRDGNVFRFSLGSRSNRLAPGVTVDSIAQHGLEKILETRSLEQQKELCLGVTKALVAILSDNQQRSAATS